MAEVVALVQTNFCVTAKITIRGSTSSGIAA
jgi:hypothetical protein